MKPDRDPYSTQRPLDRNHFLVIPPSKPDYFALRMIAACLYCCGILFTFGHCWVLLDVFRPGIEPVDHFWISIVCAAGWPLYWSAWIWAHL